MAKMIEIYGNLFKSKAQTLVNTVNCYVVMGKGIALEFKKRFPEMFEVYKEYCDKKLIRPGVLQLFKKSTPWILNFLLKIIGDHLQN
ncbi:MAG: macro domain-containing protein [Ignavibacteria bacterium]